MLVKFLHTDLRVTTQGIPDVYGYEPHADADVLAGNIAKHLAVNDGPVTRLVDVSDGTGSHEAFLAARAGWAAEGSGGAPKGVWSDNPDFAKLLASFYGTVQLDTDPEA